MNFFRLGEARGSVMVVIRELAGWLLIFFGFAFFYMAYEYSLLHSLLTMWMFAVVGIVVFRGGIHLLKVAIAARVCQQTQDQLYPTPAPGTATPLVRQPTSAPLGRRTGS
jgi:hypothetical protein